VTVTGAVAQPGVKALEGTKVLTDVLSLAGGLTADAGPTVRIVRQPAQGQIALPDAKTDAAGFSTVDVDARALLEGRNPEKNIAILPNDMIAVPRADVVYVIGEVGKPGPIQVAGTSGTTVMEAVSASGGVLRTGAPGKARLLRKIDGQDTRQEIAVDIQKMMQGREKDIAMNVGDILVVPDSTGKRASTRALEALIQFGTMVGTYGVIH
jgi:polysaccharide export outer membrane protein